MDSSPSPAAGLAAQNSTFQFPPKWLPLPPEILGFQQYLYPQEVQCSPFIFWELTTRLSHGHTTSIAAVTIRLIFSRSLAGRDPTMWSIQWWSASWTKT